MNSKNTTKYLENELVFAMDIGTHSIVGIVGKTNSDKKFEVIASCEVAHSSRAMIDGQIEDIDEVTKVAAQVLKKLEKQLNVKFKKVSVAAAGRTLVTQVGEWQKEIQHGKAVDAKFIEEIEAYAMQQAFELICERTKDTNTEFCCVGYSPLSYYLDNYKISQLKGHKGKKAKVEIIATFLPVGVVESLYKAMQNIGLEVESLTLEPIAAINAIIPNEIRMLNLALVDIGAGTSDIAISTDGTVSAYTMATIAGDELTESLVHEFLVDFNTAEALKKGPSTQNEKLEYTDILGNAHTVTVQDIEKAFKPALENLAKIICDRILEINGKAPSAIFLVGGGSQVVGLCEKISDILQMDKSRVGVGSNIYMKKMVESELEIFGPEYATPVGIALTASRLRNNKTIVITVNGENVYLPPNKSYQLVDALTYSGFGHNKIMERSGKPVNFKVNDKKRIARGEPPIPAIIKINGKETALTASVQPNDKIEITPAKRGADAKIFVKDILKEENAFDIYVDGKLMTVGTVVTVNNKSVSKDTQINDNDIVQTERMDSLGAICLMLDINPHEHTLFVNDEIVSPTYILKPNDKIYWCVTPMENTSHIFKPNHHIEHQTSVSAEKLASKVAYEPLLIQNDFENNNAQPEIAVILNGKPLVLPPKPDGTSYLFLDMLNYVDIDLATPQGIIVLLLNSKNAAYTQQIKDRDIIEIYWDKAN